MEESPPPRWEVHYGSATGSYILLRSGPQEAVATACELLDAGYRVFLIGWQDATIEEAEITRICTMQRGFLSSFTSESATPPLRPRQLTMGVAELAAKRL